MIDLNGNDVQEGIETVIAVIVVISVLISALFIIGKGVRVVQNVILTFRRFFEDWNGEPARDGVPERHGVMGRLSTVEDTLKSRDVTVARIEGKVDMISARVEHELTANHGTSIKDGVNEAVLLSEQALNAVFVMKALMKEWQEQYGKDQERMRDEWIAVFDGIKVMIPMEVEEQGPFWDKLSEAYSKKTLVSGFPTEAIITTTTTTDLKTTTESSRHKSKDK